MYWYLSFLRPPPKGVSISAESIQITPQIANDLRTELRYDSTDIAYTWQRVTDEGSSEPLRHGEIEFLTTWEPPQSTYKPISIPLPPAAKAGESYRLALFALSTVGPSNPLEQYARPEPYIVPVWSEPISIRPRESQAGPIRGKQKVASKAKDEGKQSRIQRYWDVESGRIAIIEQTSFDLDKKLWDSGLALSAWLWTHLADRREPPTTHPFTKNILDLLRRPKTQAQPIRILELGGGTGLVSIVLRGALHNTERDQAYSILTTDLPSAIPLMQENIALNNLVQSALVTVEARVLDWDQPLPGWFAGSENTSSPWPDLIIAADVTYNTASFPSLISTLTAVLKPSAPTVRSPSLLLAYKERDPAERALWELLEAEGISMEKVEEIVGADAEGAVEIWVGKASDVRS